MRNQATSHVRQLDRLFRLGTVAGSALLAQRPATAHTPAAVAADDLEQAVVPFFWS